MNKLTNSAVIMIQSIKDHFTFIPRKSQMNNDILRIQRKSNMTEEEKNDYYEELMKKAFEMPNCQGVSTLGYFKSHIETLSSSPFFRETDGTFIKKQYTDGIYICGCVKNCARFLNQVFNNILILSAFFYHFEIVIAYDHSTDKTLDILRTWQQKFGETHMTIIMGNNTDKRVVTNITCARNSILAHIRSKQYRVPMFKHFIMIDMDDVCSGQMNLTAFHRAMTPIEMEKWDAITFNRRDYYDVWAVSIDDFICSCWHFQGPKIAHVCRTQEYIRKRIDETPPNELLPCVSAFNGFGIYKIDNFIQSEYEFEICDVMKLITPEQIKRHEKAIGNYKFDTLSLNGNLSDCEHRYFHLKALQLNPDIKIRISPHIMFDSVEISNASPTLISSMSAPMCEYVSSHGIMNSFKFSGQFEYKHGRELRSFIKAGGRFKFKTVLITGDCDATFPSDFFNDEMEFRQFIEQPKLLHWFSQNCDSSPLHSKMTRMPIGLDYHTISQNKIPAWGQKATPIEQETELKSLERKPFWERQCKCYGNFQFKMNTRYGKKDRQDAVTAIPLYLIDYETEFTTRINSWKKQIEYAFVVSPLGNGYDCHRTWEALLLGCIVIMKRNPIDDLFCDLPVLLVNEWTDITEELLVSTVKDFSKCYSQFNWAKLTLRYWTDQISNKALNNK